MDLFDRRFESELHNFSESEKNLFKVYVNDYMFLREYIYSQIPQGASTVLEVGAGCGLMSSWLAEKGYRVTSLEPGATGFDLMDKFYNVANRLPFASTGKVLRSSSSLENFQSHTKYDFIFSLHVIEHVENLQSFFDKIQYLMSANGKSLHIFPNYIYPYEPHFNIPIIINKKITKFFYLEKIKKYPLPNSLNFWSDLSFPSSFSILKYINNQNFKIFFSKNVSKLYFERLDNDIIFIKSKKRFIFLFKIFKTFFKYIEILIPGKLYPVTELIITTKNKR